jgi:hypothetical protein
MALLTTGTPWNVAGNPTGYLLDSTAGDIAPASAAATYQDLVRGIGHQGTAAAGTLGRALVNQLCGGGVAMVQTVPGAEANTFTTRQAVTGTLVNTNTLGDTAQAAGTFAANALNVLGRTIRVRGGGTWGVTATPNFTFDIALGTNILATTQAFATSAVTSPQNFYFDFLSTVTTIGASAVMNTVGIFVGQITSLTSFPASMGNSTPGTGLTLDLTATQAVSANATWGASSASNRIRLFNLIVEILC